MRALKFLGWSIVVCYLALTAYAVMATQPDDKSATPTVTVSAEAAAEKPSLVDVITDKSPAWLELASLLTLLASGIAAVTPTPKDDGILLFIRKVIDVLAFNIGAAKPAARPKDNYLK